MQPARSSTLETSLLAGVAGGIDAIGLITLGGLFVSHMSGNTAALGAAFGQGYWAAGWPHLFAVPVFVTGLFCGYYWMATGHPSRRCALLLATEAVLLGLFGGALALTGGLPANTPGYFLLAAPPLFAMGLQNATPRGSTFPSTYVTGTLDRLARGAALWLRFRGSPDAAERRREALTALVIWSSYVGGALLCAAGTLASRPGVVLAPIGVLAALSFRRWSSARAEPAPSH